eukprot:UN29187
MNDEKASWFHDPQFNIHNYLSCLSTVISSQLTTNTIITLLHSFTQAYPDYGHQWNENIDEKSNNKLKDFENNKTDSRTGTLITAINNLLEVFILNMANEEQCPGPDDFCSIIHSLACLGVYNEHFYCFATAILEKLNLHELKTKLTVESRCNILQGLAITYYKPSYGNLIFKLIQSLSSEIESMEFEQVCYLCWIIAVLKEHNLEVSSLFYEKMFNMINNENLDELNDFMKSKCYEVWLVVQSQGYELSKDNEEVLSKAFQEHLNIYEDKTKHETSIMVTDKKSTLFVIVEYLPVV